MASHGIPLDKAELLGTLIGGILYGFSLLMFWGTIWVLFTLRPTHRVNRVVLTVACLLLSCNTVYLITDITRIVEAFIVYRDTFPGGPIAFLSDVSQWTFVANNYLYAIQSLIGDSVILYRCYIVWRSKRIMILPVLAWCASAVAGIGAAAKASESFYSGQSGENFVRWITPFYATAFATNLMTTALLASRIWYIDRRTAGLRAYQTSQLRKTLYTIINAGVIYNFTLLAVWICFSLESNGQRVALDIIVPIISITFYMVIIRVGWFHLVEKPTRVQAPLEFSSIGNGMNRTGVHVTAPTDKQADNDQPSELLLGPMTATDDGEVGQARREISVDDATAETVAV